MSIVERLLRRRPAEEGPTASAPAFALDWDTVAASDLGDHPGLLDDLLQRRRDGVTITGVFTPAEVRATLERLAAFDGPEKIEHLFGSLLGLPLGMITPEDGDRSRHLDDAERCKPLYRELFGVDPHERIAEVLAPIGAGEPMVGAPEAGRRYNPGQLRWWEPGRGGLVAHVGNEFRAQLEACAMQHLVTTTRIFDHLSYFVVLQRADVGGTLSVYDLTWEDNAGRTVWGEGQPDDGWIDAIPHVVLDPEPGSMVLFGGGWRWHRVDPPEGEVGRITYGGFAARSLDGAEIHFWS